MNTVGWGWSEWGEWAEDSCPEVCGRRCRLRRRNCAGAYVHACEGKGEAFELEDCPALEDANASEGIIDIKTLICS